MARPSAEARRFYTAFYQWSILATPKPAGHSCRHAAHRVLSTTTRSREEASPDQSRLRIKKHSVYSSSWKSVGEGTSDDVFRPLGDAPGTHKGQPYRLGGPQPGPTGSIQPHKSTLSHTTNPILHQPVQNYDQKPFRALKTWECVVRYRSSSSLILEYCLPSDRASALEKLYGEDLALLGRETGARVEMGGMSRLEAGAEGGRGRGVRARSLLVSGTVAQCERVRERVWGVKNGAGVARVMGRGGDGEEIRQQWQRTHTEHARPSAPVRPAWLSSPVQPYEEKPFSTFKLWERVIRYRSSPSNNNQTNPTPTNIILEASIPSARIKAIQALHGKDLSLLPAIPDARVEVGAEMPTARSSETRRRSVLISGLEGDCARAWDFLRGAEGERQRAGGVGMGRRSGEAAGDTAGVEKSKPKKQQQQQEPSPGLPKFLAAPVQSYESRPFASLRPWDKILRYRSASDLKVEYCLPLDRLGMMQGRFGHDLAGLKQNFDVRVELAEEAAVVADGTHARSLLVAGSSRQSAKMWHSFAQYSNEGAVQRMRTAAARVEEGTMEAGKDVSSLALGRSSAKEDLERSGVDAEQSGTKVSSAPERSPVVENLRSNGVDAEQSGTKVPKDERVVSHAERPSSQLRPFDYQLRTKAAGGLYTYEMCIPRTSLQILQGQYGKDLEVLKSGKYTGLEIRVEELVVESQTEAMLVVWVSGPENVAKKAKTAFLTLRDDGEREKRRLAGEVKRIFDEGLGHVGKGAYFKGLPVTGKEVKREDVEIGGHVVRSRWEDGEGGVVEMGILGFNVEDGMIERWREGLRLPVEIGISEGWLGKGGKWARALVVEGSWAAIGHVFYRVRQLARQERGGRIKESKAMKAAAAAAAAIKGDAVYSGEVTSEVKGEEAYWEAAASPSPVEHSSETSSVAAATPSISASSQRSDSTMTIKGRTWRILAETPETIVIEVSVRSDRLELLRALRGPQLEGLTSGKFEGVEVSIQEGSSSSVSSGADASATQTAADEHKVSNLRIAGPRIQAKRVVDVVVSLNSEATFKIQKFFLETNNWAEGPRRVARLVEHIRYRRLQSKAEHPTSESWVLGYAIREKTADGMGAVLETVVRERFWDSLGDGEKALREEVGASVGIRVSAPWDRGEEKLRSVEIEGSWEEVAKVLLRARSLDAEFKKGAVGTTPESGEAEWTEDADTDAAAVEARPGEIPATEPETSDVTPDIRDPRQAAPKVWEHEPAEAGHGDNSQASNVAQGSDRVAGREIAMLGVRHYTTRSRVLPFHRRRTYTTHAAPTPTTTTTSDSTQISSPPHPASKARTVLTSPTKEHEHDHIKILVLPAYMRGYLLGKDGMTHARIVKQSGVKELQLIHGTVGIASTHVYIMDEDPAARKKAEELVEEVHQWARKMDPYITSLYYWRSRLRAGKAKPSAPPPPKRYVATVRLPGGTPKRRADFRRFLLGSNGSRMQQLAMQTCAYFRVLPQMEDCVRIEGFEAEDVEGAILKLRTLLNGMKDVRTEEQDGTEILETFVEEPRADRKGYFERVGGSDWGCMLGVKQTQDLAESEAKIGVEAGAVDEAEAEVSLLSTPMVGDIRLKQLSARDDAVTSDDPEEPIHHCRIQLLPHGSLEMRMAVDQLLLRRKGEAMEHISKQTTCRIHQLRSRTPGLWTLRGRQADIQRAKTLLQKRLEISQEMLGIAALKIPRLLLEISNRPLDADAELQRRNKQLSDDVRALSRPLTHPVVLITTRMPGPAGSNESSGQRLAHCRGVTVSSFTTVTMEPKPVITFNLKIPSRTWDAMSRSERLGVHVMAATPEAAAIVNVFTQPHKSPSWPFGELIYNGMNVAVPDLDPTAPPRVKSYDGAVLGRLECKLLPDKSVAIGDHVVVFAEVHTVSLPGQNRSMTREEGLERLTTRAGLAYANRGYRGMGEQIDVLPHWQKPEDAAQIKDIHRNDGGDVERGTAANEATDGNATDRSMHVDEDDEYDFGFSHSQDGGSDLGYHVANILDVGTRSPNARTTEPKASSTGVSESNVKQRPKTNTTRRPDEER